MIKAVIFDADGPLYERGIDITELKKKLLQKFGYWGQYEAFSRAYEKQKFYGYTREQTVIEMFQTILSSIGLNLANMQVEQFVAQFNQIQARIKATPDAVVTLKQLKNSGIKICVLTDSFYSSAEKWPWFEKLGMNKLINVLVSSYDIRQLKSTKEAYQTCLDQLGTSADQTIFVGHQQYEMDGAKLAGITSVCLTPIAIPPDTKADFRISSLAKLPLLISKL